MKKVRMMMCLITVLALSFVGCSGGSLFESTKWIDESAARCWEIYEWGWKPGKAYDDSFYVEHGDFIIYQIQICAYRLAHTLNLIFDPEYKGL